MNKAIIIKTKVLPIVVEVENFSKENCLNAIGKALKVDLINLEQLSSSTGSGIYGIREKIPIIEDCATNPVGDVDFANTIEVEYAHFVK